MSGHRWTGGQIASTDKLLYLQCTYTLPTEISTPGVRGVRVLVPPVLVMGTPPSLCTYVRSTYLLAFAQVRSMHIPDTCTISQARPNVLLLILHSSVL